MTTPNGYWLCKDTEKVCEQSTEEIELFLEVLSLEPRAFVIENFLSDYEAQTIIDTATPKLGKSTVGNAEQEGKREDRSRTSRNAWVSRDSNSVTDTLFRRAADVLGMDQSKFVNKPYGNTEDLQVVRYEVGQRYDAHHDWGVNQFKSRSVNEITIALFLKHF